MIRKYGNCNTLTQSGIGNYNLRNFFAYQNGLTGLTEIGNKDYLGDDTSFETLF